MWQCGGELCPDIVSYNTVIKACGNASQIDMGFKVYQVMILRGIEPTVATFGTLVCISADAQATAHVKCAWQWLCASGLEVHITCANAYLQALLREGEWHEAQALFNLMLSPHSSPCRPNAVTFSALISACLACGDMKTVKKLYNEQLTYGIQPSGSTNAMLINAFSVKGMWGDALGLLSAMCRPESSTRPSPGTFVTVFQSLRDQCMLEDDAAVRRELGCHMALARALLKSQPSSVHPDPALFSSMIGAFQAAREPDMCVELFNNLLGCSLPIEPEVSSSILGSLVEGKMWARAVQVVRAILEYQPGNPPLGAGICAGVLMAMASHHQWTHAYEVVKALYASTAMSTPRPNMPIGRSNSGGGSGGYSFMGIGSGAGGAHEEGHGDAGTSCLSDLVDALQAGSHTDLLLLVVLAEKEVSGLWGDALSTFKWIMQQGTSVLASTRLGHTLFYELLFHHAGVEGLRESVLLCKSAHDMDLLHSFPPPKQLQGLPVASATALITCIRSESAKIQEIEKQEEVMQHPRPVGSSYRLEQLDTGVEAIEGQYQVLVEGDSHIYTIVTLLAWLLTLRDKAREGLRVPCTRITIHLAPSKLTDSPLPPPSPFTLRQLLGSNLSHLSDSQLADLEAASVTPPPVESSMLAQIRAAAALVLDGSYTMHLGQPGQDDVFLIRPPGVPFDETGDPAILSLSTDAVYAALHV